MTTTKIIFLALSMQVANLCYGQFISQTATNPNVNLRHAQSLNIGTSTITTYASRLNVFGAGNTSATSALSIFNTSSTTNPIFLVRNDGNVGIGVTSPLQKLHVVGNVLINGPASTLLFGEGATANAEWGIEYDLGGTDQTNGLNFWKPFGSTGVGFRNFILFINNNGRVGINTNNPTADLSVNGNVLIGAATTNLPAGYKLYVQTGILTEKVKIAVVNSTDWSDYVFAKDYKLKTIEELEAFVKENKHLPNVPSAEEVVKEGIDMAKMDAKLLEKIEELSLYVIQLKKENTELVKRIEKVENK